MENRLPGLLLHETDSTGERTFYYWRNEARQILAEVSNPRRFAKSWRSIIYLAGLAWRS